MTLPRLLFALSFLLALTGCAGVGRDVRWNEPGVDLVWPGPPERPRLRYLRALTTDFPHTEEKGGRLLRWMVGENPPPRFHMPYGIAADGQGKIWVADGGAQGVYVLDLRRGRVTVLPGAGDEPLAFPVGVAFDKGRGRLFVSDSGLGRVFRMDAAGRLRGEVKPPEGFLRPAGLAVDGQGNLYAADALRGTVEVFSPEGAHLRTLGSGASKEGRFNRPANVAVDGEGRVHVVDAMNFRVEILSPEGESLGTVGGVGDTPGRFARPRGIALDSAGNLYVADAAFDNIQIFDSAGRLLLVLGRPGKEQGTFCMPAGLTMDAEDRLYVVDGCNSRVQVFQFLK